MSPSAISVTPPPGAEQQSADLAAAVLKQKLAESAAPLPSNHATVNGAAKVMAPLDASRLIFTQNMAPKAVPAMDDPIRKASAFCTDHMITATWRAESGWEAPEMKPYGPLSLMPTASVFHYATECFEGLKAYRGHDGKLRLFRPDLNAKRMLMSSTRIALPSFEPAELEKLIFALVARDGPKFLPRSRPGTNIYLRPTMIGTQEQLGPQMPNEATLFIIATYMAEVYNIPGGMKLWASAEDMVRAWPGGFGSAKLGANYGPGLIATQEAKLKGYHQILWLFGPEGFVTEAGASNFMVIMRSKEGQLQLVTAPLGDKIILDGVTRRSVLQLARERLTGGGALEPLEIVERKYTMNELVEASKEGRLVEGFACGTAYFVTPVSKIHFRGEDVDLPMACGEIGDYTLAIKTALMDIMYGGEQHEWGVVVDELEQ